MASSPLRARAARLGLFGRALALVLACSIACSAAAPIVAEIPLEKFDDGRVDFQGPHGKATVVPEGVLSVSVVPSETHNLLQRVLGCRGGLVQIDSQDGKGFRCAGESPNAAAVAEAGVQRSDAIPLEGAKQGSGENDAIASTRRQASGEDLMPQATVRVPVPGSVAARRAARGAGGADEGESAHASSAASGVASPQAAKAGGAATRRHTPSAGGQAAAKAPVPIRPAQPIDAESSGDSAGGSGSNSNPRVPEMPSEAVRDEEDFMTAKERQQEEAVKKQEALERELERQRQAAISAVASGRKPASHTELDDIDAKENSREPQGGKDRSNKASEGSSTSGEDSQAPRKGLEHKPAPADSSDVVNNIVNEDRDWSEEMRKQKSKVEQLQRRKHTLEELRAAVSANAVAIDKAKAEEAKAKADEAAMRAQRRDKDRLAANGNRTAIQRLHATENADVQVLDQAISAMLLKMQAMEAEEAASRLKGEVNSAQFAEEKAKADSKNAELARVRAEEKAAELRAEVARLQRQEEASKKDMEKHAGDAALQRQALEDATRVAEARAAVAAQLAQANAMARAAEASAKISREVQAKASQESQQKKLAEADNKGAIADRKRVEQLNEKRIAAMEAAQKAVQSSMRELSNKDEDTKKALRARANKEGREFDKASAAFETASQACSNAQDSFDKARAEAEAKKQQLADGPLVLGLFRLAFQAARLFQLRCDTALLRAKAAIVELEDWDAATIAAGMEDALRIARSAKEKLDEASVAVGVMRMQSGDAAVSMRTALDKVAEEAKVASQTFKWKPAKPQQIRCVATRFKSARALELFGPTPAKEVLGFQGLGPNAVIEVHDTRPLFMVVSALRVTEPGSQWMIQYLDERRGEWMTVATTPPLKAGWNEVRWERDAASTYWRWKMVQAGAVEGWATGMTWGYQRSKARVFRTREWLPERESDVAAEATFWKRERALLLFSEPQVGILHFDNHGTGGWLAVRAKSAVQMVGASVYVGSPGLVKVAFDVQRYDDKTRAWVTVLKTGRLYGGWNHFAWGLKGASKQWRWLQTENNASPWFMGFSWTATDESDAAVATPLRKDEQEEALRSEKNTLRRLAGSQDKSRQGGSGASGSA